MINYAFPAFTLIDSWLAGWLPEFIRVCLWGAVSGALALGLYAVMSDQAGIAELKRETNQLRKRILDKNIEHAVMMQLVTRNLVLSLRFLRKAGLPSILASVPVLLAIFWLSAYHTYSLPVADSSISTEAVPNNVHLTALPAERLVPDGHGYRMKVAESDSGTVSFLERGSIVYRGDPADPPTPLVHKRKWWNLLLTNEAGYVEPGAPLDEIHFDFPRRRLIEGLPEWLSTWEFPFFFSLFVIALALKFGLRIE